MDVFSLRDTVVGEYEKFATSFTTIRADDIREQVRAIYAGNRFWPEPLLQINPNYKRTTTVAKLVADGLLDPTCAEIFRSASDPASTLSLYKHQEQAVALAAQNDSFVVTTGTGSGKSLTFFIPVVDAVLAEKRRGAEPRTRAIIVYPMNALANSQLEELEKFMENARPDDRVSFARYTGQEGAEERLRISKNPPDILLTNFMMLELLMTRQDELDRRVIANCEGLRFLVLDELHTYRGRQGADVALLVRRVRERLAPERLQCIGTSATMASEGSLEDKGRVVARVASKLFSVDIPESNVIVETLERATTGTAASIRPHLGPAIDAGILSGVSDEQLRTHPLAVWVETNLGVTFSDVDQRWVRARPLTITEAVDALAKEADRDADACRAALRDLLLVSSVPEAERAGTPGAGDRSFFAFKLHQFISGAGHAYATLEPAGSRTVVVEGQQFLPGDPEKRLYPVHFCRDCGHEYHPVKLVPTDDGLQVHSRDIDDAPVRRDKDDEQNDVEPTADATFGFLTPHASDPDFTFDGRAENYPEAWLETDAAGTPRLKAYYRTSRAVELFVAPTGRTGSGMRVWFLPGRFRFCLRCGTTQATSARDRNRLASLSAEGRSSATTVLVSSALRWMHGGDSGLAPFTRKLLGFTDNRQDAALQAGHFNDFLFVSLLRAGFLRALTEAGDEGLRSEQLGGAHQRALGFDRPDPEIRAEWLLEPALKGFNLQEAERTLREVLAYRLWFDQQRGWRYTNPNLEQLGLVEIEYLGLDELAADESLYVGAPAVLRRAIPSVREGVYRTLFDHLRRWMAIRSQVLDAAFVEQILAKSHSRIRPPWGFGTDEKPRGARWLMLAAPAQRNITLRDQDLIVRGGSRSALGKLLKSTALWGGDDTVRELKSAETDALIEALLGAASERGQVVEEPTPFGNGVTGWRLVDACVRFKASGLDRDGREPRSNAYFRTLYANLAAMLGEPAHPLFSFEAREHTAQVDAEKRAVREKRFRYGGKEREELDVEEKHLREIGETSRFLPALFCSPTMELGVDISALNAVYLRNVPPTPANYAQRSGRAGRSGQAALVLTYCSAQGPHDQYFFRDAKAMVHGEVRPPLLDLANRDLVESHLSAVWLASTSRPLDGSIAELLVLNDAERPLEPEIAAAVSESRVAKEATARIGRVLDLLEGELTPEAAPWYPGRDAFAASTVAAAPDRFSRAFDRWRDLFRAAEEQRDAARLIMDNHAAPQQDVRAAQIRHAQAIDQLTLLKTGSSTQSSDFYTYRYLATEGFLPGYNFPRLPLMAYVPATNDGRGRQAFLQRPRFLALSEFGPRSLVYHEGRAFRVVRAMLALGNRENATPDVLLPTKAVRLCKTCGAGHFDDETSMCHSCHAPLGDAECVRDVYRIENVATQPAERITANDEERQRQGYDLQTTFEWAERGKTLDVRRGTTSDADGEIARLVYGAGAQITRLNLGLRRRANQKEFGFKIDPVSGYWAKSTDETDTPTDPTAKPRQRIVPSVQDRKNALLFKPAGDGRPSTATMATLQHALLRGIETVFQLEGSELAAEPMPNRDERGGMLFYEATEGGAGVLTRLVAEPKAFAEVARQALRIMHFDVGDASGLPAAPDALEDAPDTACVAACYRCLMSYYNQPDHELLDRRDEDAKRILLRLARSTTRLERSSAPSQPPVDAAGAPAELARWFERARGHDIPAPDAESLEIADLRVPLVWRAHYVAAAIGGVPPEVANAVDDRGLELVVFSEDETTWQDSFAALARALGRDV